MTNTGGTPLLLTSAASQDESSPGYFIALHTSLKQVVFAACLLLMRNWPSPSQILL